MLIECRRHAFLKKRRPYRAKADGWLVLPKRRSYGAVKNQFLFHLPAAHCPQVHKCLQV
jgi:hypothetical protein